MAPRFGQPGRREPREFDPALTPTMEKRAIRPWIRLERVELSRAGRPVLCGITASLSGQAIGLVGANGAGKSTLIGALLGVLRPERGTIRVLDLELPRQAIEVRTRAGVMAEQAGIFPGGSGVDAVAFAGALSGLARREALRRAHRALDALEVGEERYRSSTGYSTGMRQRCKLAMSLVHDPEILILDEPTVGLDPPGRRQLLELLRELRDQGRRILLSTHLLPDADAVCDELLLIDRGTVIYHGSLGSLTQSQRESMRAGGVRFDPAFAGALEAAGIRVIERDDSIIRFLSRGDEDLRRFWSIANRLGVEVRRLEADTVSLEEAVVGAMGEDRTDD